MWGWASGSLEGKSAPRGLFYACHLDGALEGPQGESGGCTGEQSVGKTASGVFPRERCSPNGGWLGLEALRCRGSRCSQMPDAGGRRGRGRGGTRGRGPAGSTDHTCGSPGTSQDKARARRPLPCPPSTDVSGFSASSPPPAPPSWAVPLAGLDTAAHAAGQGLRPAAAPPGAAPRVAARASVSTLSCALGTCTFRRPRPCPRAAFSPQLAGLRETDAHASAPSLQPGRLPLVSHRRLAFFTRRLGAPMALRTLLEDLGP